MTQYGKKAVKFAEKAGYIYMSTNSKNFMVYQNGVGHVVRISPSMGEAHYRRLTCDIQQATGNAPDLSQKHSPQRIKERQERERILLKAERARHQARLDELTKQRDVAILGGVGNTLSLHDIKAIERLIEDEERQHRETVRLMTSVSVSA